MDCVRCGHTTEVVLTTDEHGNIIVLRYCTHCCWGQIEPEPPS
jgi:transcription elongation factor Elf1